MQRMGSREMAMQIIDFPFEAETYHRPAKKSHVDAWGYHWSAEKENLMIYGPSFEVLPEGWTFLGAGISRVAFLAPDGFVYKIPHYLLNEDHTGGKHDNFEDFRHTNFNEAMTYAVFGEKIASEHPGYRLARSEYLYDIDVQVMEYVERDEIRCLKFGDTRLFESYGITDLHGGNVWVSAKDGAVVCVDYAATMGRAFAAA